MPALGAGGEGCDNMIEYSEFYLIGQIGLISGKKSFYFQAPDFCPYCKKGVVASSCRIRNEFVKNNKGEDCLNLFSTYLCPSCLKIFIVLYEKDSTYYGEESPLIIHQMIPYPSRTERFDHTITSFSNRFVQIYNEAFQAEQLGLTEICGVGYRKSLEILIKRYALKIHPESKESIIKSTLGSCINKYIDDEKIKKLATAATRIGNDETHYERRYENKDINDMKRYIRSLVLLLQAELDYEEAYEFIEENN